MSRGQRNGRRAALEQAPGRRGGGLFLGILIGLVGGLVVAAGIAWYLNSTPSGFKQADQPPPNPVLAPETPSPAGAVSHASKPAAAPGAPERPAALNAPPAAAPQSKTEKSPPRMPVHKASPAATPDYTFFDILPGDQAGKAPKPEHSRQVWWLQVAALREANDADRLKARLALLGLPVQTQKVTSGQTTLHRVRVGPFKTEDEALGALDTLSEHDYEPRLLKEQLDLP